MAGAEKRLTARQVATAKPGRHADGGGLYLEIDATGRRSWIFRYRFGERRRDMGLGSAADVTLAQARDERDRWRAALREGRDPIEARRRAQDAGGFSPVTFGDVAKQFLAGREGQWRSAKHAAQWRMTLDVYAAALKARPVAGISTLDVLTVLKPIWQATPETAARLRGRIEMVLDAARALGHIDEGRANPARWKGHLDKLLPRRGLRHNFRAMPWREVPAFVASLRVQDTIAARALEFAILTAARTGEALGATRDEIDVERAVWTVPGRRMKSGREHNVPLSPRALAIVLEALAHHKGQFVFPGRNPKRPLSGAVFQMMLRRRGLDVTGHGFRSAFADWRGDATSFPKELAEAALAHVYGDATERAYRRGDALDRRRALMNAWAGFLDERGANVVRLSEERARNPVRRS